MIMHRFFDKYARRPVFWLNCVLFFLIATPFELQSSGLGWLIKLLCVIVMVVPLAVRNKGGLHRIHPMLAIAVAALVVANVLSISDRAILAIALIVTASLLGQFRNDEWLEQFGHILFVYLAVHAAGFLVQLAALWGTANLLDLHSLIFPGVSRIERIGLHGRLSGFHVEPGTYSQWMLMSVFLRSLIMRRLLTPFNAAIAFTGLATTSLWGALAVGLFLIAVILEALMASTLAVWSKNLGRLALLVLVVAGLATQVPGPLREESLAYLETKAEMKSESGMDKLLAIGALERDFWEVFFLGGSIKPGFCPYCVAPNDAGLWANAIYYFGFLVAFGLAAVLVLRVGLFWGVAYLPLIAAMFVWKAHFYDPFVWVLIGHIMSHSRRPYNGLDISRASPPNGR